MADEADAIGDTKLRAAQKAKKNAKKEEKPV